MTLCNFNLVSLDRNNQILPENHSFITVSNLGFSYLDRSHLEILFKEPSYSRLQLEWNFTIWPISQSYCQLPWQSWCHRLAILQLRQLSIISRLPKPYWKLTSMNRVTGQSSSDGVKHWILLHKVHPDDLGVQLVWHDCSGHMVTRRWWRSSSLLNLNCLVN